ncbi:hypothetical protein EHS25_001389 [Saitozyma podzolica]|uniref:Uncharacterized protein n=1 Tax=Saitozyma podzolica TaxID=1890683 RepID=A0A427YG27_9TREE|nr:hypothetical protein EHS25_001389 [Saitozyma podzolica]
MSELEEDLSAALLPSPWLAAPTASPPWLLKHAPHPHRPGYVLLLTDLSSVYLEVLTAPSVPSRIREVKRATPSSASGDSRGKGKGKNQSGVNSAARWLAELEEVGDVIKESEMALKRIGGVMDRWEEVQMEVREHDYHDRVLEVTTSDFAWLFNLTELNGREPLRVLADHLIAPLAHALASEQSIALPRSTVPVEALVGLLSHKEIAEQLARPTSVKSPKRSKKPATPRKAPSRKTKSPSPVEIQEEPPVEEEEDEEYRSPSASASPSPSPPSPSTSKATASTKKSPRRSGGHKPSPSAGGRTVSRDDDGSTPTPRNASRGHSRADDDDDEDERVAKAKPAHKRTVRRIDEDEEDGAAQTEAEADDHPTRASTRRDNSRTGRKRPPVTESGSEEPAAGEEDEDAQMGSESSQPELEPEVPQVKPSQSSQKSRKEREAEDDEELERRLKEMKRKMKSGGGGRLGRRRFAR